MRVVVAQIGAREHFLAARALHRSGMLAALVVDWYVSSTSLFTAAARILPGQAARRALGAHSTELPGERVHALSALGLMMKLRQSVYSGLGRPYAGFLCNDAAFARALVRLDLPDHDVFFGYSYASLEMLAAEKKRGTFTILDQIDPGPEEHTLVAEEGRRWPRYVLPGPAAPEAYYDRNRREWELADVIVVNSEWSRHALLTQGVPDAKIEILPLAYEAQPSAGNDARDRRSGPLKVLWLGTVCLRKGVQYLIETARRLLREPVEFLIAGPVQIPAAAVADAPANMRWLGQVPRSQAHNLYAEADVFVLPTISDGFAITQLEALSHGVPVIVTPNCGRVVEDGQTGFIVPPRDAEALAEAILRFVKNRDLAGEMSPKCIQSAKTFSVDAYAGRLARIIERHSSPKEMAVR